MYDYSKNPFDKITQRKEWQEYRADVRAETNLKTGKHASMCEISKEISRFASRKNNND